jgi:hypothetical protein
LSVLFSVIAEDNVLMQCPHEDVTQTSMVVNDSFLTICFLLGAHSRHRGRG